MGNALLLPKNDDWTQQKTTKLIYGQPKTLSPTQEEYTPIYGGYILAHPTSGG
jgi:hypothetical protein